MQENYEISLAGRIRLVFAAGAFPGAVLASVGDFFSPVGGWLLPLLAGLLAILVLIFLVLRGDTPEKLRKTVNASRETQGIFEGALLKQPGIWALSVFACISIFVGLWSHGQARQGGVLASNVSIVSDAQQVTGLMKESLKEQSATRIAVEGIERTGKKETSSDPRKELANQGIAWNETGIKDAIRNGDARTLELFIQGGMKVPPYFLNLAIRRFDSDVLKVLSANPGAVRSSDCSSDSGSLSSLLNTEDKLDFFTHVCDRPEIIKSFRTELAKESARIAEQERANESVASDRKACVAHITRDWPMRKIASVPFPGEINGNGTVGDIPEELVASKISQYLLMPRMPSEKVDDDAVYRDAVVDACTRFYAVRNIDKSRAKFLDSVLKKF